MKTILFPAQIKRRGAAKSQANAILFLFAILFTGQVCAQPVIITQPTSQVVSNGGNAVFSVAVSGAGPFTYQWQFNGINLPNNDIISTVAGGVSGSPTSIGDGSAAINAYLSAPYGLALDNLGDLFIADSGDYRVRKVDAIGIIHTVAGTNVPGFSEDGGLATSAKLNSPRGMALDFAGNLYIADANNNRIRKIGANGIITTVAGTNSSGFSGDGGLAVNASLNLPSGVACDGAGNLFIADLSNNRIRKMDTNGIITTIAGTNSSGFSGDGGAATNSKLSSPSGVACDGAGNVYIADSGNNRVRMVNTNGIITTFAGSGSAAYSGDGGMATNAGLSHPTGVAADGMGDLFIADNSDDHVRMVNAGGIITTVAGNGGGTYSGDGGSATNAGIGAVYGLALDATGNLFLFNTASGNARIRKVTLYAGYPTFTVQNASTFNAGNYSVVISGSSGSVTSAVANLTVQAPPAITTQPVSQMVASGSNPSFNTAVTGSGPFGYLWFVGGTNLVQSGTNGALTLASVSTVNSGNYTVVITNDYGSVTSKVATLTVGLPPSFNFQPESQTVILGSNASFNVAVGGTGPFTYQWRFNGSNLPNNIITTVAGTGIETNTGDGGPATNAGLYYPESVCFDAAGKLYVGDHLNNRIRRIDTNGIITTFAGNGVPTYAGDAGAATNASLGGPASMVFDAAGNLYIADQSNNRIRKVGIDGTISTVAGNGSTTFSGDGGAATNAGVSYPYGVVFDSKGNLYFSDLGNNRVRKVDTGGIITTVAGNGNGSFSGDGGLAVSASLYQPAGLGMDASGNLYIADSVYSRIRKVNTNGIITSVAGGVSATNVGDGGAATNASIGYPIGLNVDAYGNIYIGDIYGSRLRRVDTNGIITTVAGNGSVNFSGDGGAATNAGVVDPQGSAFDASGNLFIAEWGGHRIREVHYAGFPSLSFANTSPLNAGNYSVVITSPYGSVTSSVVSLSVLVPPTIQIQSQGGGLFTFAWNAVSNATYQVQYATNLAAPVWQNLGAAVIATNSIVTTSDIPGADEQRFYRVLWMR